MSQRLLIAQRAARAAGKVLAAKLHDARDIRYKGKRDIVTDADYAADRTIKQIVLARFPDDKFVSEEGNLAEHQHLWAQADASNAVTLWVVDPLDGTTNYSRTLYAFCTSLAVYRAGQVQVGVVYDPMSRELYSAERGRGAFLNGKPIHVSAIRSLEGAVFGAEWARAPQVRRRSSAVFARILQRVMTGRVFGSAALSICHVAAGRMDGYMHLSLAPWDVAAAALIAEEAGGKITTPTGAAWTVHSKEYVASNGHLHPTILKYFR
ncbi:MAG: inositol monophosphatase [Anaerolineales bacterium]|nr:inositol monophosphatase [Anaerolineales bacterium]